MKAVKSEIDEVTLARGKLYRAPETLRKRDEGILRPDETRTVEANEYVLFCLLSARKPTHRVQSTYVLRDANYVVLLQRGNRHGDAQRLSMVPKLAKF